MNAVLRSIKPYFLYLILIGRKKIELGKDIPKGDWNKEVYLYCSKDKKSFNRIPKSERYLVKMYLGKVACKFICDEIIEVYSQAEPPHELEFVATDKMLQRVVTNTYENAKMHFRFEEYCAISKEEIRAYLGDKKGYGWSISELEIFDEPKELGEFCFPSEKFCEKGLCGDCPKYEIPSYEYGEVEFDCEWKKPIEKAPQSWCYVKEISE